MGLPLYLGRLWGRMGPVAVVGGCLYSLAVHLRVNNGPCIVTKEVTSSVVMSAIFDFPSLLVVLLLTICTCAYVKERFSSFIRQKHGMAGVLYKFSVVGRRLSLWVGASCVIMAFHILFIR